MYKLMNTIYGVLIRRVEDGVFIPASEDNTDYQAYLAWLAEGNEPLPADEPTNQGGV